MKIISIPFLNKEEQVGQDTYPFDFIEYRLDYTSDWYKAEKMLPFNTKTIITIRDTAEGGVHSVPLADKISYYERVIRDYNVVIDLELRNFEVVRPNISEKNLIISRHILDEEADVIQEIEDTIEKGNKVKAKFLKVVAPISSYSQLLQIRQLSKKSVNQFLFVGTGKLGKLTRILWRELGSIGTYLGFEGQKTSSSQLTPDEDRIYDTDSITENTLIGGLIGGEQVYNSLGLNYYNQMFRQKELNAIYLPLPVDELEDFIEWTKELQKRYRFYGFSVTMPFKRRFPEKITGRKTPPYNLVIPRFDSEIEREIMSSEPRCYNTDEDAFFKSFAKLDINIEDRILILGTGGVAETLLKKVVEYPNVILVGRNKERLVELGALYKRETRELSDLNTINYEVLINCSPLGMNGEDLFEVTGLNYPQKMIDLPYVKEESTATINRCIELNIPYIDGKTFWNYQAERQEELFLKSIYNLSRKNSLTGTFSEIDSTKEG